MEEEQKVESVLLSRLSRLESASLDHEERLKFLDPELKATHSRIDIVESVCDAHNNELIKLSKNRNNSRVESNNIFFNSSSNSCYSSSYNSTTTTTTTPRTPSLPNFTFPSTPNSPSESSKCELTFHNKSFLFLLFCFVVIVAVVLFLLLLFCVCLFVFVFDLQNICEHFLPLKMNGKIK
jgi:hypothetical protein